MGVYWGVKVGFDSRPRALGPKKPIFTEPGVAKPNILVGSLPFAIVLLPCIITLLKAKSLSDLVGAPELRRGFFQQIAILEQSEVEKKKS